MSTPPDPLPAGQADGVAELGVPRLVIPTRRLPPLLRGRLQATDQRTACRCTVGVLALSHDRSCEAALAFHLEELLDRGAHQVCQGVPEQGGQG